MTTCVSRTKPTRTTRGLAPIVADRLSALHPIIEAISDGFTPGHPLAGPLVRLVNWYGITQSKCGLYLKGLQWIPPLPPRPCPRPMPPCDPKIVPLARVRPRLTEGR